MDFKKLPLPRGKHAIVDTDIYEEAAHYRWCQHTGGYVQRWIRKPDGKLQSVFLHKLIAGAKKGQMVKFLDENKLNLRRDNLLLCTKAEISHMNTKHVSNSRYRGVFWDETKGKYTATITHEKELMYIGSFKKEKDAALCYDVFSRKFYKDKAFVNFPNQKITEEEYEFLKQKDKKQTSRFRGVSFHPKVKMWRSRLIHQGMAIDLGLHATEEKAAMAYDKAAKRIKKADAKLNFT